MEEDFPSLDEYMVSMGSQSHLMSKLRKFAGGEAFKLLDGEPDEIRIKRDINFFYRMGYDYVPDLAPWSNLGILLGFGMQLNSNKPGLRMRQAPDTADGEFSRGLRFWQDEKSGFVQSWEDFDRIPWDSINLDSFGLDEYYDYFSRHLPEGMKLPVVGALFDPGVVGTFFGLEDLCFALYDQPDLVRAVVDKWGQLVYDLYERILHYDCIGFLWHADDLGFKTNTFLSYDHLQEYILPWFKKYTELGHKYGRMVWLHSCGNVSGIMEDLIEDVGIDAKHSFEDQILSITDFMAKYGSRIAGLGGVDMDKLCRMDEKSLRVYCREILDQCMPMGRYAFGTGNTVANYIPLNNYLAMMEEGYLYK